MNLSEFPSEILTPDEENAIAATPKGSDDRDRLVMHNMREALLYAKKCCRGRLADGELMSVAYLGLREAAANFLPNKIRFFGYAKAFLRGKIYSEFRSLRVVKKSESVSFQPSSTNGEEEQEDFAPTDTGYYPLTSESENFDFGLTQFREEWRLIEPLVRSILTDKERMILELKYISGMNFRQIGEVLAIPVSRSHIQHIHSIALAKIQAEVSKRKITFHCSNE